MGRVPPSSPPPSHSDRKLQAWVTRWFYIVGVAFLCESWDGAGEYVLGRGGVPAMTAVEGCEAGEEGWSEARSTLILDGRESDEDGSRGVGLLGPRAEAIDRVSEYESGLATFSSCSGMSFRSPGQGSGQSQATTTTTKRSREGLADCERETEGRIRMFER